MQGRQHGGGGARGETFPPPWNFQGGHCPSGNRVDNVFLHILLVILFCFIAFAYFKKFRGVIDHPNYQIQKGQIKNQGGTSKKISPLPRRYYFLYDIISLPPLVTNRASALELYYHVLTDIIKFCCGSSVLLILLLLILLII